MIHWPVILEINNAYYTHKVRVEVQPNNPHKCIRDDARCNVNLGLLLECLPVQAMFAGNVPQDGAALGDFSIAINVVWQLQEKGKKRV